MSLGYTLLFGALWLVRIRAEVWRQARSQRPRWRRSVGRSRRPRGQNSGGAAVSGVKGVVDPACCSAMSVTLRHYDAFVWPSYGLSAIALVASATVLSAGARPPLEEAGGGGGSAKGLTNRELSRASVRR